jgi:hypothetical protein
MKKYTGIWLDQEKAFIITILNGEEDFCRVSSDVEGRARISGGLRSKTPYGPQEAVSEKKREERRRHQLKRYYQAIINEVKDSDKLFIFGPGEAKLGLEREIKKSKELYSKMAGVEKADKMTEAQMRAKVRSYFIKERK